MKRPASTLSRLAVAMCVTALGLAAAPEASAQSAPTSLKELTKGGSLGIGATTTLSFTNSLNTNNSGEEVRNNTTFLLVNPEFGFFFSDRAQLSITPGFLLRRLQRDAESASIGRDWVISGGVKYHIDVTQKLALIPGIGGGFYIGSSQRPVEIQSETGMVTIADESTRTFGGNAYAQFMFGYLLGERTTLQAGIVSNALLGRENISSNNLSNSVRTINTSLNFGIFYFF